MERIELLLSKKLFNDTEPTTMEEVEELYDKLLNFRGAVMWQTASDQFPEDEVIFIWNRSMISQSLERAWHLPITSERVDDSIQNFKITYYKRVRFSDLNIDWEELELTEEKIFLIESSKIWTNDEFRDAVGYDWMWDKKLFSQGIKRDINLHAVKEVIKNLMEEVEEAYKTYIRKQILEENCESEIEIFIKVPYFQVSDDNDRLILMEFNPEMLFPFKHRSLVSLNDDEEELVKQDYNERFINWFEFEWADPLLFENLFEFISRIRG